MAGCGAGTQDQPDCIINLRRRRRTYRRAIIDDHSPAATLLRLEPDLTDTIVPARPARAEGTVLAVILAVSLCHMINDIMQSLLAAIYPMLKTDFHLDFWQIGLLTMAFQVTASLLQPLIGMYTDKRPLPYSLPVGMASSLVGLVVLAFAHNYAMLVVGAVLIGFGSAIFHPESSRVARLASGGRFGLAQSMFQLGGNFGQAIGPLLAAFIVVPFGQGSVAWFTLGALVGIIVLWQVGGWYSAHLRDRAPAQAAASLFPALPRRTVVIALVVLTILTFTKNIYMASLSSYYTFYAIEKFGVSVQESQLMLFVFLGASAAGMVLGGLFGDRFGAEGGDLVLDPRRAAVHAGAALCRPVLDQRARRRHRPDPVLGLLGDRGVRAGTGAGPRRHDRRHLLRLRLRHRRHRRRRARRGRRPQGHRLRLLALLLPAAARRC